MEQENKKSQVEIVREKLYREGEVNNLWALTSGIWRLGAVIKILRDDGENIETEFNTERVGKNCHYKLIPRKTLW